MNIKKEYIKKLIIAGSISYISISDILIARDWINFYRQNRMCRDNEYGEARLRKGDVQECLPYSEEQTAENPSLREVKLYFLPGNSTETKPYVIFLPGGAYIECNPKKVALPCAAEVNAAGYSAFILCYRVRHHTKDMAPLDDLAAAIRYISEHAAEFNVCPENYMITGFSAGGNLAGLFCSNSLGYKRYGLNKPAALSLIYPWSNINARIKPSGNIVYDGYKLIGRIAAENVLLGFSAGRKTGENLCIHNHVNEDFPPCYIVQGNQDFLAPNKINSDLLVKKLSEFGRKYEYHIYPNLTHGFGIGRGTAAEGWLGESIRFWKDIRMCSDAV